jgi:hypothetical protein
MEYESWNLGRFFSPRDCTSGLFSLLKRHADVKYETVYRDVSNPLNDDLYLTGRGSGPFPVSLSASTGRHFVVACFMSATYIKGLEGTREMGTAQMYLIPALLSLRPMIPNFNLT